RRVYGAIVPAPVSQKRLWVLKQPLGVVAAITPWNFPATMVTRKIAPALAAGCPVVLKPASATPLTALALAEILHEVGLPAGVVVQGSMAARFIPAFTDRVQAIKVGDGFQPGVEVGPLINEATLDKVERLVQDAVAKGAQVAVGGQRLRTGALSQGWFYAPTVLLDVRDEMPVCQEEIFGPVAPVLTFRTEAELIARANATTF